MADGLAHCAEKVGDTQHTLSCFTSHKCFEAFSVFLFPACSYVAYAISIISISFLLLMLSSCICVDESTQFLMLTSPLHPTFLNTVSQYQL